VAEDENPLIAVAAEVEELSDTISFLVAWRSHQRAVLRGALEATGHKSSSTLVPGKKIGLSPRKVLVCSCHEFVPYACPNHVDGETTITCTWIEDGDYLYVNDGR